MRQLWLNIGRRLLLLTYLMVFAIFCFGLWLGGTQRGGAWALAIINDYKPGLVRTSFLSGTLFDGIKLETLDLNLGNTQIHAKDLSVDWKLAALLNNTVKLNHLRAQRLEITREQTEQPSSTNDKPLRIRSTEVPLQVELDELEIDTLHIRSNGKPILLEKIRLVASIKQSVLDIETLSASHLGITTNAHGSLDLQQTSPWELKLEAHDDSRGVNTTASIQGLPDYYDWTLTSDISTPSRIPATIKAHGTGNLEGLDIETALTQALEGTIKLNGPVKWKPALSADIQYSGKQLNPAAIDPELQGAINVSGYAHYQSDELHHSMNAEGSIRTYPFLLSSEALIAKEKIDLDKTELRIGKNTLTAKGTLSSLKLDTTKLELGFDIDAPLLTQLHPQLTGSLQSQGFLSGDQKTPKLKAHLSATNLGWNDNKVQSLEVTTQPSDNLLHLMDLKAQEVSRGKLKVEEIDLNGLLGPDNQFVQIQVLKSEKEKLTASINSVFDEQTNTLSGTLLQTKLYTPNLAVLEQTQASSFEISGNTQKLESLCLENADTRICSEGHASKNQNAELTLNVADLPIKAFAPELPSFGDKSQSIDGSLTASRVKNNWDIASHLSLDEANQASAEIKVLGNSKKLEGQVQLGSDRLQWLSLLSPSIAHPKGKVEGKLKIFGTTVKPQVRGDISLKDGELKIPRSGTQLSEIELDASISSLNTAKIEGHLNVNKQALNIKGDGHWKAANEFALKLNAQGEHLLAVDNEEAQLYVSPDLTLVAKPEGAALTGTISIPEAVITPKELPSGVARVSSDERIISTETREDTHGNSLPLSMNVALRVGSSKKDQAVVFDGFGLNTALEGAVQISQIPGRPIIGDGSIRMIEGRYKAYGQDLDIEQGEFFFNGPLNNPGFSLRAFRTIGEIQAGLQLRGTLDQPETVLFSEPPLSETDTLSYLLTGQAFHRTNTQDGEDDSNALLITAASRLGLKAGGRIIDNLQERSGIDTFKLSTEDDINQSALLIGKYLTPKLYIQYAMKLFEETDLFQLSYSLTPNLLLEAESGTSQGLDLIYRLERD